MDGSARQEDFVFAEHVLRRGFATEDQVQECLRLVEKLHGEMGLADTLENILLKKGYLAKAQASVIRGDINPEAGRTKNQIEGYQLLTRLGSGAMGSVYKAHHMKLNIPVALKVLRVDLAKSRTQVERLKREAQLAARLNHPNIVRSLDVGESNGFNYFAMEFVDGLTVRQMLRKGRLKEKDALRITRDVARALEHAHSQGVVHRDIKPANIILTKAGVVKLADFGLARGQEPSDLTLDQASIGTPQYLAPEQARRAADATIRSDLFSLGASLYHMVTARPPFSGGNLGEIFQKVLGTEFDPPESVVPDLSVDTIYLIHRLMRGNPRERYHTPADLLADLDRLERGQRIAPADFKGDYAVYIRRRRRKRALLGTAAIAVIVVATVLSADMIKAHVQESNRAEVCRTADRFGKHQLERVGRARDALANLSDLHGRLKDARPPDCRDEEVALLLERTRKVQTDLGFLEDAEAKLVAARGKQPDFVRLAGDVDVRIRQIALGGPRERAEAIRREIGTLSKDAADKHYARVFRPVHKTSAEALSRLEELEKALHERYLKHPLAPEVSGQTLALRRLIGDWKEADETFRKVIDTQRDKHRYVDAHRERDNFVAAREKALERARAGGIGSRAFLEFFPDKDPYEQNLKHHEREYFEKTLLASVKKFLEKHDTKEAAKVLDGFRAQAVVTRDVVAAQDAFIRKVGDDLEVAQNGEIRRLTATFRRALRERRWRRAWEVVQAAVARTDWTPDSRRKLKALHYRAGIYEALFKRYQANPGSKAMADYASGELLKRLKFDDKNEDDVRMRAYFYVGESFVADNPRTERDMLRKALGDLRDDTFATALARRERDADAHARKGEIDAARFGKEYSDAANRKDAVKALQSIVVLLTRFSWTEYVAARRDRLKAAKADFENLSQPNLVRLNAGIPPRNFIEDVEHSRYRMRFDFQEWWPYEETFENPAKNRRQLDGPAEKFWRKHHQPKKLEPGDIGRIKHQLWWFNKLLVPANKKLGGARFAFDKRNTALWAKGPREELGVITLENPFKATEDWSIELSIAWDVTPDGALKKQFDRKLGKFGAVKERRINWFLPHYFALAAGQFQIGIVATGEGEQGRKYGGGAGARLFKHPSLYKTFDKHFKKFHGRTLGPKPPRHAPDLAYIVLEEEPYRVRLERKGNDLICTIAKHAAWKRRGGRFDPRRDTILELRVRKHDFDRDVDINGLRNFRILSLEPCRLIDVVIEGEPREATK